MTELYHIHTKGIRDDKWKVNKELIISDNFVNSLGKKCNEFNDCNTSNKLNDICDRINYVLNSFGFDSYENMPIHLIIEQLLIDEQNNRMDKNVLLEVLKLVKFLSYNASIFKREMAMEQYRKDNNSNLPSRLHCVYATDEDSLDTWRKKAINNDIEVYRIDIFEEPFKTSEIFIPDESFSYKDMYSNSYNYWNPKFKNIGNASNEYLVKGKIKILEKVAEFKKI